MFAELSGIPNMSTESFFLAFICGMLMVERRYIIVPNGFKGGNQR